MDEPVRWVSKAEAAQELEISLSTLDRKIRSGEIEAVREDRRVYVRMQGPEYLSDDELLRRALDRAEELRQTALDWESALEVGAGTGRGPGTPHPPVGRPTRQLEEAYRRSGPRTEGLDGWLSGLP